MTGQVSLRQDQIIPGLLQRHEIEAEDLRRRSHPDPDITMPLGDMTRDLKMRANSASITLDAGTVGAQRLQPLI